MDKFINAEAFKRKLIDEKNFYPAIVARALEEMPAADVVEVVRCSQCKHLTVHNSPTLYAYCEKEHIRFEPFQKDTRTHFCSYGKRRSE